MIKSLNQGVFAVELKLLRPVGLMKIVVFPERFKKMFFWGGKKFLSLFGLKPMMRLARKFNKE
jgi:hypothetical protein